MGIRFECHACKMRYEVAEKFAGRTLSCKKCGVRLSVPAVAATVAATAPAGGGAPVSSAPSTDTPVPATPSAPIANQAVDELAAMDTQKAGPTGPLTPEDLKSEHGGGNGAAQTPVARDPSVPYQEAWGQDTPKGKGKGNGKDTGRRANTRSRVAAGAAAADGEDGPMSAAERAEAFRQKKGSNTLTIGGILLVGLVGFIAIVLVASGMSTPAPSPSDTDDGDNEAVVVDDDTDDATNTNVGSRSDAPIVKPLGFGQDFEEPFRIWTFNDDFWVTFAPVGGSGDYDIEVGTSLPDGLELVYNERKGLWRVQGEPDRPGLSHTLFVLRDRKSNEEVLATVEFDCREPLALAREVLPAAMIDREYHHVFVAAGGTEPYTWSLVSPLRVEGLEFAVVEESIGVPQADGSIVEKLVMVPVLKGTPTESAELTVVHVRVTDAEDASMAYNYPLSVEPEPTVQRPNPNPRDPRPQGPIRPGGGPDEQQLQQLNQRGCEHMQNGSALIEDGDIEAGAEEYRQAIAIFEQMLEIREGYNVAYYNLACAYSLGCDVLTERSADENLDLAMQALLDAVENGYANYQHMLDDGDLENLRTRHPDWDKHFGDKEAFLSRAARATLADLKREFGDDYLYEIDEENKLIFATNQSQELLDRLKSRLLAFAEGLWENLFPNKPDHYVAIILPNERDFRQRVPDRRIGGFYNPSNRRLIAGNIGHTLTHEFTHAMHFGDLAHRNISMPIWFTEGLSTCFEDSEMKDGVPTPYHNMRLAVVQQYLAAGRTMPFTTIMQMPQPTFMQPQNANLGYAQARYMSMWMWQQDKLKEFYITFCETFARDPSGQTAMTRTFGMNIQQCEQAWKEWLGSLERYNGQGVDPDAPYLGVRFDVTETGLAVTEVIADGPAERAGLAVGDIIIEVGGRVIDSSAQLSAALKQYRPGDLVKIAIVRGGRVLDVPVRLGRRP